MKRLYMVSFEEVLSLQLLTVAAGAVIYKR